MKKLKVLTSEESTEEVYSKVFLSECKDTLKYWTIYGMLMVFDLYIEVFLRWIPGWYYFKAIIILAITFPHLKISSVVFDKGIVPFLHRAQAEIESHGGIVNVLSFAVYSAPFLLVDIIFPVKVQGELWKEYIKKSFRISRSPITTRSEGVYDLSKESTDDPRLSDKVIPITSMENFDSAVDYVIPSPGTELSPANSEGRDDSIDLDMSMNMSLEAEKLSDLHLPGLALKGQPLLSISTMTTRTAPNLPLPRPSTASDSSSVKTRLGVLVALPRI